MTKNTNDEFAVEYLFLEEDVMQNRQEIPAQKIKEQRGSIIIDILETDDNT